MIVNQLKARFRQAEPVSRELAAQFQGAFQHYRAIRDDFFSELPSHLHASELVTLVNVELKSRLFHPQFCEQIQDELRALRRTLIRLEDLRAADTPCPTAVNDLEQLAKLGEGAEALYQRHWEQYRYPTHLNEEALARLLLDIHHLCEEWDAYFARFSAVHALVDSLSGQSLPPGTVALRIAYTQAAPLHFSVGMLKTVIDFLESSYGFVAALSGVDPVAAPLALLQVEVADPVELAVAVPAPAHAAFAAFLQYLFLKDMLKRDALLKYVCEAVERQFGAGRHVEPGAYHKDLALKLKALPATGRFTISGRSFPDDQIAVLQDFTATLERNQMDAEALLGGDKPKPARKTKAPAESAPKPAPEPPASQPHAPQPHAPERPAPAPPAPAPPAPEPPARLPERPSTVQSNAVQPAAGARPMRPPAPPDSGAQPRQHLHILTERVPD